MPTASMLTKAVETLSPSRKPQPSPNKLVFSKPDALRAPLKISIPLPQLLSSSVHVERHRRSLTRDLPSDTASERASSLSSLSSSDSEGPTTPSKGISVVSPSPHAAVTIGLPRILSSTSSSPSSSSSSEESSLASPNILSSPVAVDDLTVFGASKSHSTISQACLSFQIAMPPIPPASVSSSAESASQKVLRSVQTNASPNNSKPSRPRYHHRGSAHACPPPHHHVGPFQFLESLNNGSYGSAYAAKDLSSGRVLCAKVCLKERAHPGSPRDHRSQDHHSDRSDSESSSSSGSSYRANCDFMYGMRAEMLAYKRIAEASEQQKKWLMELHGVLQDPERVVFVMDLMEADLFSLLASPAPPTVVRRWIAQIALGIDALHNMGVIHRDIKPENILIVPSASHALVRITDFTNAWVHEDHEPLKWWRNYSRRYIGTKEYLAPEIHRSDWYGITVDWWALGCLIYDLLVGDALFPDERAVNFYISWRRDDKSTQSYLAYRANFLDESEIELMAGLLSLDPYERFRLDHLEKQSFFTESGPQGDINVFDEMRAVSASSIRKRINRSWATHEVDESLKDEPLCFATASRSSRFAFTSSHSEKEEENIAFEGLAWINPVGALAGH